MAGQNGGKLPGLRTPSIGYKPFRYPWAYEFWRRTNKEWQGIAMSGSDVVNRRQSRTDTASFLKLKFGLKLTPSEERSVKGATDATSIMKDLQKLVENVA